MNAPFAAEGFQAATNVSRETIRRLEIYAAVLRDWQARVNLVGPGALADIWHRHFLDSAQLLGLAPPLNSGVARTWVDIGSGAGFPGLVLAIMGAAPVHLVEATEKKCAFLAEVAQATGTEVHIHCQRAEDMTAQEIGPSGPDMITARAVARLPKLLKSIRGLLVPHTAVLVLAGQNVEQSLTDARKSWNMAVERLPSVTHPASHILRILHIQGLRPNGPGSDRFRAAP